MPYSILLLAPRKAGITHFEFASRYEQHMRMVLQLSGDAAPLSHTRWYIQHDEDNNPALLAGNGDDMCYDAVVLMTFRDEAAWGEFFEVLKGEEASRLILEDEAGFWDRERMKVMVVGGVEGWGNPLGRSDAVGR